MTDHAITVTGARVAEAAAALIGCPFRLHGRDPATGLDCVGLVMAALAATGAQPVAPHGYRLCNLSVDGWLPFAERSGLTASPGPVRIGEVLLIALGHCQHHLVIMANQADVIHAHAGLRRVVRQPLEPTWRICAKWSAAPVSES
jgi:hypothetical protein